MIINLIKEFFRKKEGVKKYKEKLNNFIIDQKLSDKEKEELDQIIKEYNISNKNIIQIKKDAFILTYNRLTRDSRLSKNEIDLLQDLLNYLDFSIGETGLDLNLFRKYVNLATIEGGVLPDVTEAEKDLNIIYKNDEILHYRVNSLLRKLKRITKSIQYGGFTASVKITRGLRYRAGSIKVGRTTTNVLAIDDSGMFYITNQRVGYHGQQKQFAIPFDKISSLELRSDGLYLFKEGKEQPYIVTLDDYEVPLAITSFIMNKNN
jgi:hypothetical protein